ncbi:KTSC domain-containing protein [Mesorhizobium mediterraneum]|nr:KTSC domain-containing protein [Mesorhizobium mediterraneum]
MVRRQQQTVRVEDVPAETFAEFKAAFAKGQYFNEHIPQSLPVSFGCDR